MTAAPLVRHLIARQGETLPAPVGLYDYILAGNGVYIRARRPQIQACVPIAPLENDTLRGLENLSPTVQLLVPRVPADLTRAMRDMAREEKDNYGHPIEVMFHLTYTETTGWVLVKPAQRQGVGFVHPVGPYAGTSYATYLVEVHSHHELDFHEFSSTDDESEGSKFRLYGLLYDINGQPGLRLRLNIYGYQWELTAKDVFEMPAGLRDPYLLESQLWDDTNLLLTGQEGQDGL